VLDVPGGHPESEGKRMTEQCLWKISDVAQYLGVPLSSIYKMTGPKSALRIPHVRISGRVRFRKTDIDEWLNLLAVTDNGLLAKVKARITGKVVGNGIHP
jgi:excisionase family DNA binding protein